MDFVFWVVYDCGATAGRSASTALATAAGYGNQGQAPTAEGERGGESQSGAPAIAR